MKKSKLNIDKFKVVPNKKFSLKDYDTAYCDGLKNKKEAEQQLHQSTELLSELQYKLYAENKQALLIVFQAMDAAGKDGAIKHVFSGVNPQGCDVDSFKSPSTGELAHDYLWRHYVKLPAHGKIGIFNRSHYENVLITRVHPEILMAENLPGINSVKDIKKTFWDERYKQINHFEKTLTENGTTIIKFFLHLSKDEQKKRFLERIENPDKNWKFSSADITERTYWDDYQDVYEKTIRATSTDIAPWYIIPADHKWYSHVAIGSIIVETMKKMKIKIPTLSEKNKAALELAKQDLIKD